MRAFAIVLLVLLAAAPAAAQSAAARYAGRPVEQLRIFVENTPTTEPGIADLVEVEVGQPLSIQAVRESITHLYSIGRFQDIRVEAAETPAGGVSVLFNLIPLHLVQDIDFTGSLELSPRLLRRTVVDRYGDAPPIGRAEEVARTLRRLYQDEGYLSASVRAIPKELHDPDRTVLVFDITAGPRALVGNVQFEGKPLTSVPVLMRRFDATRGAPYRASRLQAAVDQYRTDLRTRGYYRATTSIRPQPGGGNIVDLYITIDPGPLVTVRFEGDRLPQDRLNELVPIRRESSIDEDLLEDAEARIENHLRSEGYWKADVTVRQEPGDGTLAVVFRITRGLQYRVAGPLEIRGNESVPLAALQSLVSGLEPKEIFREAELSQAVAAIARHYHGRGFATVSVIAASNEVGADRSGVGLIQPAIVITEGPRVAIGDVLIAGNTAFTDKELRDLLESRPGDPYDQAKAARDRDQIVLAYLNKGYAEASVDVQSGPAEDPARTPLHFLITEGPQTIVDHILIVGNVTTAPEVIRRELQLREGEPLGLQARFESHSRLTRLNLFRRVRIDELTHSGTNRHDVVVTVEEAPRTSLGYGGGVEVTQRLRATGPGGDAEERTEFGPRGFFDIGRRNVGGRNRSVNLFTRVSLRPRDVPDDPERDGTGLAFSEYRVVGTFRQPRSFGENDVTVTGAVERGVRSSFSFSRQGVNAEVVRRLTRQAAPVIRVSGRYSFSTTRVFNDRLEEDDRAQIDRAFPQVRLSGISGALVRDTRDDALDPQRGTFVSVEGSVFARGLGGQVGFMKSYVQGFWFRRLAASRRIVLATRAAVGLADGFEREAQPIDSEGNPIPGPPILVEDLPASERFFAGGDSTIRGYALDSVGSPDTISPRGFPTGGNAVLILNSELRLPVWRDLGAALFVDGGNVFRRATQFDAGELRGSVGFGVRYDSPIGPVRVDLGFKLDRRMIGDRLESRTALHFSIGNAF
jgi:outer membrane protein assembly complex protein YaeT